MVCKHFSIARMGVFSFQAHALHLTHANSYTCVHICKCAHTCIKTYVYISKELNEKIFQFRLVPKT